MLENRTEIFRVKTGPLEVVTVGLDYFAFWSRIRWNSCLIFGEPVARLIEERLGLGKRCIRSQESFEYSENRKNCRPCIIFYVSNPHAIENSAREIVRLLIAEFVCRVVDKDNFQLDSPEGMQSDQAVIKIATEHAHQFISDHGGNKLTTPLLLQSFLLSVQITKCYMPKPSLRPKNPERFVLKAQVVSLGVLNRKCSLFVFENETEVSYSPNIYFTKLKNMLGEALEAEFALERTWDASGKEQIRIASMDEIKALPNLLI